MYISKVTHHYNIDGSTPIIVIVNQCRLTITMCPECTDVSMKIIDLIVLE